MIVAAVAAGWFAAGAVVVAGLNVAKWAYARQVGGH